MGNGAHPNFLMPSIESSLEEVCDDPEECDYLVICGSLSNKFQRPGLGQAIEVRLSILWHQTRLLSNHGMLTLLPRLWESSGSKGRTLCYLKVFSRLR